MARELVLRDRPRIDDSTARGLAGMPSLTASRVAGWGVYALANLAGVLAFLFLLLRPALAPEAAMARGVAAPVLLGVLAGLCLLALAVELGADGLGSRAVAVLGVLVAMNAVLRFAEAALPGPGGFSPIFVLVVLAGYVYGGRFGFLTGAMTLAMSAVITGGVGPWLPFQMYAAGWVGLTAGWLPGAGAKAGTHVATVGDHAATASASRRLVWGLAAFGAAWGFGYGLLLTVWDWSFVDAGAAGAAGAMALDSSALARFVAFYAVTSMGWDAFRAGGTFLLLLLAGAPLLAALRRFGLRFRFEAEALAEGGGSGAAPAAGPASAGRGASLEASAAPALALPAAAPIHARAWLAWTLGLAALASVTRNPFLLAGAVLGVAVTRAALPPTARVAGTLPVLRVGAVMVAVAAVYNFFMSHGGATVVARLPASWPLVGGPLTLESLVYGALTGLALATLLAAFATLRLALGTRDLLRLVPRAFGALALVSTVALTYVPATLAHWAAVREAQAVRGRATGGLRGWAPLVVPLVVGGLERALVTAESLAARGLVPARGAPRLAVRLGLLVGMTAVVVGLVAPAMGWVPSLGSQALVVAGGGLVVAAVARQGRRLPHTDFHATRWRWSDGAVLLAAWLPVVAGLVLPGGRAALAWLPYPSLVPPPLPPALALALAGLAAPAGILFRARRG